jgi:hypothetical protein
MMLAIHLPVGALAGRARGNVATALCAGVVSHAILDLLPHDDVVSERTEAIVVASLLPAIALGTHWDGRAFFGALGGVLPDLEHVVRVPGSGGRLVFPTHGPKGLHEAIALPFRFTGAAQIVGAAALFAVLFARRRSRLA